MPPSIRHTPPRKPTHAAAQTDTRRRQTDTRRRQTDTRRRQTEPRPSGSGSVKVRTCTEIPHLRLNHARRAQGRLFLLDPRRRRRQRLRLARRTQRLRHRPRILADQIDPRQMRLAAVHEPRSRQPIGALREMQKAVVVAQARGCLRIEVAGFRRILRRYPLPRLRPHALALRVPFHRRNLQLELICRGVVYRLALPLVERAPHTRDHLMRRRCPGPHVRSHNKDQRNERCGSQAAQKPKSDHALSLPSASRRSQPVALTPGALCVQPCTIWSRVLGAGGPGVVYPDPRTQSRVPQSCTRTLEPRVAYPASCTWSRAHGVVSPELYTRTLCTAGGLRRRRRSLPSCLSNPAPQRLNPDRLSS